MNQILTSSARSRLLDAAVKLVRVKGYNATTVDELCAVAGVSKGAFFHHFKGKEDLAIAAAGHWSSVTGAVFLAAPYAMLPDPLDRLLGYISFRGTIITGELPQFTCFAGTTVQEVYQSSPAIGDACGRSIREHAARVEADIALAMKKYGAPPGVTAKSLSLYTQAVIQGAFILAKAEGGPEIAKDCLDHLRRYVEMLFRQPVQEGGH